MFAPSGSVVRLSKGASTLLEPLERGVEREELLELLQAKYPSSARDVVESKLAALIRQLGESGALEGVDSLSPVLGPAIHVEGASLRLTRATEGLPTWLTVAVVATGVLAGVLGIALVCVRAPRLDLQALIAQGGVLSAAIAMVLVAAGHEGGHFVAASLAGTTVVRIGLLEGQLLPRPAVEVRALSKGASRWRQALLPFGGPLGDLAVAGTGAALLRCGHTAGIVPWVFVWACASVALGTSPLRPGDGPRVLAALADDGWNVHWRRGRAVYAVVHLAVSIAAAAAILGFV